MARKIIKKKKTTQPPKEKKAKPKSTKPKTLNSFSLFQKFQHKFDLQQEIFDLNDPKDGPARVSALAMYLEKNDVDVSNPYSVTPILPPLSTGFLLTALCISGKFNPENENHEKLLENLFLQGQKDKDLTSFVLTTIRTIMAKLPDKFFANFIKKHFSKIESENTLNNLYLRSIQKDFMKEKGLNLKSDEILAQLIKEMNEKEFVHGLWFYYLKNLNQTQLEEQWKKIEEQTKEPATLVKLVCYALESIEISLYKIILTSNVLSHMSKFVKLHGKYSNQNVNSFLTRLAHQSDEKKQELMRIFTNSKYANEFKDGLSSIFELPSVAIPELLQSLLESETSKEKLICFYLSKISPSSLKPQATLHEPLLKVLFKSAFFSTGREFNEKVRKICFDKFESCFNAFFEVETQNKEFDSSKSIVQALQKAGQEFSKKFTLNIEVSEEQKTFMNELLSLSKGKDSPKKTAFLQYVKSVNVFQYSQKDLLKKDIVNDLKKFYEIKFMGAKEDEKVSSIEVFTDSLLALLSSCPSLLAPTKNLLYTFLDELTPKCLKLIFAAVDKRVDIEEEESSDEEEEEGEGSEEEKEEESEVEEEIDNTKSSDEDSEVELTMNKKEKDMEEEETSSISSFDDEDMFARDHLLSEVFKQRKIEIELKKSSKLQERKFLLNTLDIIEFLSGHLTQNSEWDVLEMVYFILSKNRKYLDSIQLKSIKVNINASMARIFTKILHSKTLFENVVNSEKLVKLIEYLFTFQVPKTSIQILLEPYKLVNKYKNSYLLKSIQKVSELSQENIEKLKNIFHHALDSDEINFTIRERMKPVLNFLDVKKVLDDSEKMNQFKARHVLEVLGDLLKLKGKFDEKEIGRVFDLMLRVKDEKIVSKVYTYAMKYIETNKLKIENIPSAQKYQELKNQKKNEKKGKKGKNAKNGEKKKSDTKEEKKEKIETQESKKGEKKTEPKKEKVKDTKVEKDIKKAEPKKRKIEENNEKKKKVKK